MNSEFGIRNSEFRARAGGLGPIVLVFVIGVSPVAAQTPPTVVEQPPQEPAETEPTDEWDEPSGSEETFKVFEYGSKGLDLRSRDGNYHAHIEWRAQMRFTSRLHDRNEEIGRRWENRIRLQWDISF